MMKILINVMTRIDARTGQELRRAWNMARYGNGPNRRRGQRALALAAVVVAIGAGIGILVVIFVFPHMP